MKYLQDYQNEKQSLLFEKKGAFFAFSKDQFLRQKKDGVTYVNLDCGLICPKGSEDELISELDKIYKEAIQEDLKENSKIKIIKRELNNYECYYSGDIQPVIDELSDYGVSATEISEVFQKVGENMK